MRVAVLLTVAAMVLAACSGGDDDGGGVPSADTSPPTVAPVGTESVTAVPVTAATPPPTPPPTTVAVRSSGPSADVSEAIVGDRSPFIGAASLAALPATYVEEELVAAGAATDYTALEPLTDDGRWTFTPSSTAPYRTRVLVRRPVDPADFGGTVIVEWLNVSGGLDANPEWSSLAEEIVRSGAIWVGVSAQLIGVAGGPVLVSVPGTEGLVGTGLRAIDPARYGTLQHPGDGYSFDIFTQVARAVREGGSLTGGVMPRVVIAAGESQSAIALTTYYDGVQPLTEMFDGFFVHSRANVSLPLVAPGQFADLAGAMASATTPVLRDDLKAPVMELQAESDVTGVLNSVAVRQDDSATFRLWEVAGTAHADLHLLGATAAVIDCGAPINNGPMHVVAKAAWRALADWVQTGAAPPIAPRIETSSAGIVRDADGIAVGGVRTPLVDVPRAVLSGQPGPNGSLICLLLGSTTPLSPARLSELYPTSADYESRFAEALDEAVAAGFVLADDRDALAALEDSPT
jgi:Alpha/beta hydrolase domain